MWGKVWARLRRRLQLNHLISAHQSQHPPFRGGQRDHSPPIHTTPPSILAHKPATHCYLPRLLQRQEAAWAPR